MRGALQRAWRGLLGVAQRLDFGMRAAAVLRPAAPDDDAVLHDHRADRRVRPGVAETAAAERKGERHEAGVVLRASRARRSRRLPGLLGSFARRSQAWACPRRPTIRRARRGNPWPRGNCGRPRRSAHRRRRRARADAPSPVSPIVSEEISFSPRLSSSRTIFETILLDALGIDRRACAARSAPSAPACRGRTARAGRCA